MTDYRRLAGIAATALAVAALAPAHAQTQAPAAINSKWVTVLVQAEPPALDSCNSNRSFEGPVIKQSIVETLIDKSGKDGKLRPRLATSWEQVEPTKWRFKLREGVTFHDGEPFNAEAVVKSMSRVLGPEMKAAGQFCSVREKFFLDVKLELTAVDPTTLQIVTDKPDPILPARLSFMTLASPKTAPDKQSLAPVGTGAYIFDSWTGGQDIRLRRNDKYWGDKPVPEGARFIWRNESAVRAAMVKVGEADMAFNIAPQDANDKELDHSYLNSETTYFRIDLTRPPLNDRRVRLALNYAVNRDAFRGTVLSKDLIHATQMVMPSIPGHNHELDKMVRPFDIEKARQLIAEAKKDGVPVETEIMMYGRPATHPGADEVIEAMATSYKAIGLNVKVKNLEPGQYNEINNKPFAENRGPTLTQSSHDNNTGDPIFSALKYSCKGPQSMLCDDKIDAEINRIATLSGDERSKAWQELFRVFYEDMVVDVWLYHMVANARVSKRIKFAPDFNSNTEIRIQEITFN